MLTSNACSSHRLQALPPAAAVFGAELNHSQEHAYGFAKPIPFPQGLLHQPHILLSKLD